MSKGIELIAAERQRQIEKEGFTAKNDDNWEAGELALAGACYAVASTPFYVADELLGEEAWPWEEQDYKPSEDRIKNLVKAGDTLYLYTGLRTKSAKRIGAYRCNGVKSVIVDPGLKIMFVDGLACTNGVVSTIARADGFTSLDAFFGFFATTYGPGRLEDMELIAWNPVPIG